MAFSVTFNERGFVHVTCEGPLDMAGLLQMMTAGGLALKKHACWRVLTDYRRATLTASIIDLYEAPKLVFQYGREIGVSASKVKRALVVTESAYKTFHFFETVSINNSQTVKIFTEIESATDWLMGE